MTIGKTDRLARIAGRDEVVVLPRGSRVARCVTGDSTAGPLSPTASSSAAITTLSQTSLRRDRPTTELVYARTARFWSKWYYFNGTSWVTSQRYLQAGEAAYSFIRLSDHHGWRAPVTAADLTTAQDIPLAWLVDTWSQRFLGRYVDTDGVEIVPDYVFGGFTSSSVATNANPNITWDPAVASSLYHLWTQRYYQAGINALLAEAQAVNPEAAVYVESMTFTAGGIDTGVLANAQNLGVNLQKLLHAFERRQGGKVPTVLQRPYATGSGSFPYHAEAQLAFDAQFGDVADGPLDWYQMEGCSLQEEATAFPGVHPDANGASLQARRICEAIDRMAARGQTMVPITTALSS